MQNLDITCFKEYADFLKTIGHPARLKILHYIQDKNPCVSSIEKELGLSQSNISQHLSLLRNSGIVHSERKGNNVCYSIKDKRVVKILKLRNKN